MKKYKIKYQEEARLKTKILDEKDLKEYLSSKNILEVKEVKTLSNVFVSKSKIDDKTLNTIFYELNLMLKAKLNIGDALAILIKNQKNEKLKYFLQKLNYAFSNSKAIYKELEEFKINSSVKALLQISQTSSNISFNIEAISRLLSENIKIKKSFYKAISYPLFLIFSFFVAIFAIFLLVIPNFKAIFQQSSLPLPLATKILLYFEEFLKNYWLFILLFILLFFLFLKYLYNKNPSFNYLFDKFLIKIFPFYLNFELYRLFLVIDIMQKSRYEFHKAFQSSKLLLKNKYLLDKIRQIDTLLENGKAISYSFSKVEVFDDIVLSLINTGEFSNSLGTAVCEIKEIYKNRFDDSVNFMILLIQPIFLILIASLILFVVFAIFMPIWDIGSIIN